MGDNSIRIIDIDGHVREADDLFERYLEAPFRERAPKVEKVANGQLLFRLEGDRHHRRPDESPFRIKTDGSPVNEGRHLATNPKQRLEAMDRDRIDRGLLFPSAGLYLASVQEDAYAAALCRAYNNWHLKRQHFVVLVHAPKPVRQPAGAGFEEDALQLWMTFQCAAADQT